MSLLLGFVGDKVFQMILSELESHAPEVQQVLLQMASRLLTNVISRVEGHLMAHFPEKNNNQVS